MRTQGLRGMHGRKYRTTIPYDSARRRLQMSKGLAFARFDDWSGSGNSRPVPGPRVTAPSACWRRPMHPSAPTRCYSAGIRRRPLSRTTIARTASANVDSVGIGGRSAGTVIDAVAALPTPPLADVTALVVLT